MNGWIAAVGYLVVVGFANIFWKLSSHLGFHSAVYVSQGMMAGAFVLLLFSRPGKLTLETFRHINTWLYGVFFFMNGMIAIYGLQYLDAWIILLMTQLGTVIGFFLSWLFISAPMNALVKLKYLLLIVCGLAILMYSLPPELVGVGVAVMLMAGTVYALRNLTVQVHKQNKAARNFEQEVRVTGIIMATSGLSAYFVLALLTLFDTTIPTLQISFAPTINQLFNASSIITATIYGVLCFSTMRYLEFYSVKRIGGVSFMAMAVFLPVTVLSVEAVIHALGLIPLRMPYVSLYQIAAFGLIVGGGLGLIWHNRSPKTAAKNISKQQLVRDREIAASTIQFVQGDEARAAKLLGISESLLQVVLSESDPAKAIPEKFSRRLHDNFTKHVAFIDALTGLYNQNYFMTLLNDALARGERGALYYLDLNKFKPVNDTYGHNAGDVVLRVIAQRLQNVLGKKAVISRLGGDEFAAFTNKPVPNSKILASISQPIEVSGIKVEVGASIGLAHYPDDGSSAEALVKIADMAMYQQKMST